MRRQVANDPDQDQRFAPGDRVRVDIPDETHPDHRKFHGRHGKIIAILSSGEDCETGYDRRGYEFRVVFDEGGYADFKWVFLRPPIVE